MSDLHVAINERDKIIDQLTESLKQSLHIRDQLHDQSERLTHQMNEIRMGDDAASRKNWQRTVHVGPTDPVAQRLSEITLDLISGSEYEDVELHGRIKAKVVAPTEHSGLIKESGHVSINPFIDVVKNDLTEEELKVFTAIQDKLNVHMQRELEVIRQANNRSLLVDRNEKDLEINRLKHLITNMKDGSAEIRELRQELDSIHKKEMEDLRMYFERKCSDLEKQ